MENQFDIFRISSKNIYTHSRAHASSHKKVFEIPRTHKHTNTHTHTHTHKHPHKHKHILAMLVKLLSKLLHRTVV